MAQCWWCKGNGFRFTSEYCSQAKDCHHCKGTGSVEGPNDPMSEWEEKRKLNPLLPPLLGPDDEVSRP